MTIKEFITIVKSFTREQILSCVLGVVGLWVFLFLGVLIW